MTKIIPVASGKGGVGKTAIITNLAVSLSKAGKTVIVVDLDLGGSNVHTCLGIKNTEIGIGGFINKKEKNFENLIIETQYPRLYVILGDALYAGVANLNYFMKKKILKGISELTADFVLLDLGAGTSYNTIDFFLCSYDGFIVTLPETTSILNAYSFLKNAIFRLIYLSFPVKSEERKILDEFFSAKTENIDKNMNALIKTLKDYNFNSGTQVEKIVKNFHPRIIMNKIYEESELSMGHRLKNIVDRNLQVKVDFIAFLPEQREIHYAVNNREPLVIANPDLKWCHHLGFLTKNVIELPDLKRPILYEEVLVMAARENEYLNDN